MWRILPFTDANCDASGLGAYDHGFAVGDFAGGVGELEAETAEQRVEHQHELVGVEVLAGAASGAVGEGEQVERLLARPDGAAHRAAAFGERHVASRQEAIYGEAVG